MQNLPTPPTEPAEVALAAEVRALVRAQGKGARTSTFANTPPIRACSPPCSTFR